MSEKILSRFAPTPSGLLHLGNAFNFLLIDKLTREREGEILLRIDDLDSTRSRDEYLVDIFESLNWLELSYQHGPKDLKDFKENFSQSLKKEHYRSFLTKLEGVFTCQCTRSEIKKVSPEGIYPGTCRQQQLKFIPEENCLRYTYDSNDALRDFVIWRKDDLPSYQLVSSVEDIESGVNLVIRGEDLLESTKAQKLIIQKISPNNQEITFLHHDLLPDQEGHKLSKSEGALSLKHLRESDPSPQRVLDQFEDWYEKIKDSIR